MSLFNRKMYMHSAVAGRSVREFEPSRTIGARAQLYRDRTRGFDYLRVSLAIAVILWHSWGITYGREAIDGALRSPVGLLVPLVVPMFFALSGYLVTMSFYRTDTIGQFLMLRGIRIFPALVVEILLAALILGPFLTTAPLREYFGDPDFWQYFLNCVGLVQYVLPGVFEGNPYPRVVNGSLWTVPYELECYLYFIGFALLGAKRARSVFLLGLVAALFVVAAFGIVSGKGLIAYLKDVLLDGAAVNANLQAAGEAAFIIADPAQLAVASFLAGAAIFAYRDRLPYDWRLAMVALLLSLSLFRNEYYHVAALPIAYLTVWIGLLNPPATWLVSKGDYSYGMYLYAFPIQQLVVYLAMPQVSFLTTFAVALVLTFAFAVFSWHLVEKPFQMLKKHVRRGKPPVLRATT